VRAACAIKTRCFKLRAMSPAFHLRFVALASILTASACALLEVAAAENAGEGAARLAARSMQLLHANCLSCHNEEKHKGGLQLHTRSAVLKGGDNGPVIVAGKPKESSLFRVLSPEADPHMPPKKQLNTNQIDLVRRWILAGAPWDEATLAKASAPRNVNLGAAPVSYQPVFALALSADGRRLAVGRGNRIAVHDLAATNFPVLVERAAHDDVVRSLAWSPDGRLIASGSFRELKVWDSETMDLQRALSSNIVGRITAIRFTPDGEKIVVAESRAADSGWIRVFSRADATPLLAWNAHADSIADVALSPDGQQTATAGNDKFVRIWKLDSGKQIAQLEHGGALFGVGFNTNGTEVVAVDADKQLKVWDIKTRERVVGVNGKRRGFTTVVWSGNGKTIIAGGDDGWVLAYSDFKRHSGMESSETAKERQLFRLGEATATVAVSHDGERVFAGSHDGVVHVLNATGKLLARLEASSSGASLPASAPSFVRDVLPALSKAGCMAGSCHAKPEGQNGFKLSVFNYDPKSDFNEIVKESRGRRIFPSAPEESLLLLKPTMAIEHGGGERFEVGSETYKLLVAWIRHGMLYQHTNEPALAKIEVIPGERTYRKGSKQQLRVVAHYSDRTTRDVTRLADYIAHDTEIARVDETGKVDVSGMSGESVVVARYMGFVDAARFIVPAEKGLPRKRYAALPVNNFIDGLAYEHFRKLGLFPSERSTDTEFLRRSSLDTIGVLPNVDEVRDFLADDRPDKRQRWIERLLVDPAYSDHWANKWADLLRPNPDRVGVKSVFTLDQWLRESFRANKPYDQFVREILLVEGSNHRDGPAVVYRDRRDPPELTTTFSQLFLGTRMECAKCHHHPNEKWSQDDFYQFAAFFGPVKQKGVGLSPPISAGAETFYFAPGRAVRHPVTDEVMKPRPPDGMVINVDTNSDPRPALANWLTTPDNPFFARAAVNRVWAAFFGRGFVNPVDDFRISNPPVNEPLLNALAADFAAHGYDLKHLMRTILSSHLYQLSSTPNEFNLTDTKNFSRSYRRRLPAEVLLDAVNDVTGVSDDFNGCPPGTRAAQTWSYKVKSQFLDAFGRPNASSDCPCERDSQTSVVQSLHMMNSRALQSKLSSTEGWVKKLASSSRSPEEIVTELYLRSLARFPMPDELKVAAAAFVGPEMTRQTATEDVLWALLNSPEFVFNH
jgi:WD40 repeat protein/mono/diheme cytochrome c family protein